MTYSVLVVDDEADIRDLVSGILNDHGYEVETASCYVDSVRLIQNVAPNLVILDVWLGDNDKDSTRLLEFVNKEYDYVPVIMMSGHGTIETAVSAIKQGAYDFIEKPFDSGRLITSIEKALEAFRLKIENAELKVKARVSDSVIGKSPNSVYIRKTIEQIAPLSGRCVIVGPNGADKETVAREIHRLSKRAKKPFGHVPCGAYSTRQLEAELFGIEIKTQDGMQIKQGTLERINGGTLFIEELAMTSSDFQLKFLKMLKDGAFSRIGSSAKASTEKAPMNIRVIASFTNNIEQLISERKFNDELFYRLNANIVKIAPLCTRREDIPLLLDCFMEQASKAYGLPPKKFSNAAFGVLSSYSWPGDVLQLRSVVDWVLTTSSSTSDDTRMVSVDGLPREIMDSKMETRLEIPFASTVSELSIRDARLAFEREYFLEQLRKFSGSVSQTAKFVGMDRTALHRKLKLLDISDIRLCYQDCDTE
jgi:two-component system nitrogen regulation response regulator NtrX